MAEIRSVGGPSYEPIEPASEEVQGPEIGGGRVPEPARASRTREAPSAAALSAQVRAILGSKTPKPSSGAPVMKYMAPFPGTSGTTKYMGPFPGPGPSGTTKYMGPFPGPGGTTKHADRFPVRRD